MTAELALRLDAAAAASAEIVAARAKERAPVATGRLRDAIHVERDDNGFAVIAGDNDVFYGHIVEHGSVRTSAHPFMIPALEESRGEILGLGRKALEGL